MSAITMEKQSLRDQQAKMKTLLDSWHEEYRRIHKFDEGDKMYDSMYQKKADYRGNKYVYLNVGTSGAFMMEKETELIYCIKAFGKIDKRKCLGKLEEVTGTDLVQKQYWYLR